MSRIPVKLDRNAFWSATEVGFQPVKKAEHQGCSGQIPPESGLNRNLALDSGPQQTGTKTGMCHLGCQPQPQSKMECSGMRDPAPLSAGVVVTKTRNAWIEGQQGSCGCTTVTLPVTHEMEQEFQSAHGVQCRAHGERDRRAKIADESVPNYITRYGKLKCVLFFTLI